MVSILLCPQLLGQLRMALGLFPDFEGCLIRKYRVLN